ncbi:hypothetical protein [Deinococcus ruber]|uniref:Uncharacterized protein n=1 Tax=Deinococcus ruber TaxID=1848197 RepID=A0A918CM81_9DEIO|nr:hypothetical protein [Deinococcus ruber]GGR31475.1 hypothetical protein GCM10008957_47740 [Deinococcus ruber]
MSWEEIQRTPLPVLRRRLAALERSRARARLDYLEDHGMVNEINTGQEIIGKIPGPDPSYKVVNTPYDRHRRKLARVALGLPIEELPEERAERIRQENKRFDAFLMN